MYRAFLAALSTMALATAACAAEPATPAAKPLVYAWFPKDMNDWQTKAIDWSALTHICFRSVILQPDGSIKPAAQATPERVRALVAEAHKHGVKVTVLTWGTNAKNASEYLAHHAQQTADALLAYVKEYDLDGVNMDDETWGKENLAAHAPNRDFVTAFFKTVRATLKKERPQCHLSWAAPPVISAKDKFGEAWPDYAAIAEELDAFTIMSYCMMSPNIGWTQAWQPIAGGGKVGEHARDYATLMDDYEAATGGAAGKLALGLGNDRGGYEWDCKSDRPRAAIVGKGRRLSAEEARANAAKHGRRFDPEQKAPWYCYAKGDAFVQGWYEDDESLVAKLDLVVKRNWRGICVWVLDGANEPPETFKVIRERLTEAAAQQP